MDRQAASRPEVKSDADAPPALGVPVGPRPSGQATNSRALPDPPDCEFDFVDGVINIPSTSQGRNDTADTLRHFPSSFLWIKDALLSVVGAVIPVRLPVLLPLREVVPELAYLHREERVHSKIQPVPYDLCTHSEQEPYTISKRQGDLVPVPCCCRGTEMCS